MKEKKKTFPSNLACVGAFHPQREEESKLFDNKFVTRCLSLGFPEEKFILVFLARRKN
jgi:hypothetical protein